MRLTSCAAVALATLLASVPAAGQELPRPSGFKAIAHDTDASRPLVIPADAVARETASLTPAVAQRDSVKNGATTGAVIGGIAAALFAIYLCNAVGEEGDPPCWRGVLAVGAIGAGVGAAAGAGIDAARSHSAPTVVVRARF